MQIIPGALLGLGMLTIPESARWLAQKNRNEDAWKALTWIRASDGPEVQEEMDDIRNTIEAEREATRGSLKVELRQRVTIFRLLLSFTVMMAQVCTGANALAYFSPQFFTLVVGEGTESLLISGIFGAIKIISCGLFVLFLSERLGRRLAFCGGAIFMSLCLLCVAVIVKVKPPPGGGVVDGAGIAVVALIYLAIIAYNMSWGPLGWLVTVSLFLSRLNIIRKLTSHANRIYVAEVLSPRTRDLGVAIALGTQWIFNIIWSVATPYMITNIGWATFLFFAVIDAFSAVFAWFFVKETMGKSLEEMELEFHSEAGAQLDERHEMKDGREHAERA